MTAPIAALGRKKGRKTHCVVSCLDGLFTQRRLELLIAFQLGDNFGVALILADIVEI
jgi:hypothetical protein